MSSKLHKPSLARVAEQPDGKGIQMVFDSLIEESEELGNEVGQVCMPFIDEGDEFVEGEWVPEFWFIVRVVASYHRGTSDAFR